MYNFADSLLAWFDQYGRKNLPWQRNITPYRVWISEIMLQQTQVNTVIPYYENFIRRFQTIEELAVANHDEVLHQWTGLGYYARAHNLHATARTIMHDHNGEMPLTPSALEALPGIGRSTAAAIAAICTGQSVAILDGNVKRVLARIFAIGGWPGKSETLNQLWEKAEQLTPSERVADYTQAIMDLGAIICTRSSPNCQKCPFESNCQAHLHKTIDQYPGRKPKKILRTEKVTMLIIESTDGILLEKRPQSGIWAGLWSFPELSHKSPNFYIEHLGHTIIKSVQLPSLRHTFTHYHLDIKPLHIYVESGMGVMEPPTNKIWFDPTNPSILGLSGVVTKILESR